MAAGLYVHVPFCSSRCGYCGFVSEAVGPDDPLMDRYLDALRAEWDMRSRRWTSVEGADTFTTAYVGGGTPTWLGRHRLGPLTRWVQELAGGRLDELTVEANPESLDEATAVDLTEAGVSRVSIGAQSMDAEVLRALGRTHEPGAVARAVANARAAGTRDVSLDLICGGPEETSLSWTRTVDAAIALEPDHVSVYGLSLEPGTRFARAQKAGQTVLPSTDEVGERLEWAWSRLMKAGFAHYEVSNFAKPGHECLHNLNYWRYGPYMGLGASAVSRIGDERVTAPGSARRYLSAVVSGEREAWSTEVLDGCVKARERVMLGLRLAEGVCEVEVAAIDRACGSRGTVERVETWRGRGLVTRAAGRVALSAEGMLLSNDVLTDLTVV